MIREKLGRLIAMSSAAVFAAATPAYATPSNGFSPAPVSNAHVGAISEKADRDLDWDLLLKTKDDTDVAVDRVTVAVGGQSGWHSHKGPLFVTIVSGTVKWHDGGNPLCTATTYTSGQSFIEPAGRPHRVENIGAGEAQFIAVRIVPTGQPVRVDQNKPTNCDF